jgi:hypothetical protein
VVQPAGYNPAKKKAAQTKRQRSPGSASNEKKEEKTSTETVCLLTSEAI